MRAVLDATWAFLTRNMDLEKEIEWRDKFYSWAREQAQLRSAPARPRIVMKNGFR